MSEENRVVALSQLGALLCPRCARSSEEVAILQDPESNGLLMRESGIAVVRSSDLKGGEKCSVCRAPICAAK